MAVLASLAAGCGGSGDDPAATPGNSSFSYSPVTAEQVAQVQALWQSRDLAPAGVAVYHEDARNAAYTLRIYEHRVNGRRHYGVITFPKAAGHYPVVLIADGLNQADPSMDMGRWAQAAQARLGELVFVVPVFRGRTLIYNGISAPAEGDFCDAFDGAADDSIALLNVAQAEIAQADFTRLMVRGASRGGNTALLLGERDARVTMVAASSAPTDFYRQSVAQMYGSQYRCQFFDGKTEAQSRERMIASSPLHFPMLPNVARVYIDHGALEDVVPPWNAVEMDARLDAQGVDVDFLLYSGFSHDLSLSQDWHRRQAEIYETFLGR
jgi:dipeptidyl aminopeptidase/acylaminoacyl peptidase